MPNYELIITHLKAAWNNWKQLTEYKRIGISLIIAFSSDLQVIGNSITQVSFLCKCFVLVLVFFPLSAPPLSLLYFLSLSHFLSFFSFSIFVFRLRLRLTEPGIRVRRRGRYPLFPIWFFLTSLADRIDRVHLRSTARQSANCTAWTRLVLERRIILRHEGVKATRWTRLRGYSVYFYSNQAVL